MLEGKLKFQNIYDTYRPKIQRYLIQLVGEYEAEDLTQEVFVKVSKALENFRGESQPSTWIYRIATNAALDKLRSRSFATMTQKKLTNDSITQDQFEIEDKDVWSGEQTPSVDQQLVRREMNECIRNFIEDLPENYRTVVILSELEGLKNQKIADILRVSLETVKMRLHRARAKLRKELESNCDFYHDERNELACDLKSAFEGFQKTF